MTLCDMRGHPLNDQGKLRILLYDILLVRDLIFKLSVFLLSVPNYVKTLRVLGRCQ